MLTKICVIVTALHLVFLPSLSYEKKVKKINKKQKIVVRTINQQTSPFFVANLDPGGKKNPLPSPSPMKKTAPPKTAPPKTAVKKKVQSIEKKQVPGKQPPVSSKDLQKSLKEIEERIAKIATKNDKLYDKSKNPISSKLDPLPKELTFPFSPEEDYSSSLVDYLERQLRLPDTGEVKIELILRKDGKIEKITVLSAKSERNKQHLEEQIPRLQFPPFPKEEGEKKSKVFILTFYNDL